MTAALPSWLSGLRAVLLVASRLVMVVACGLFIALIALLTADFSIRYLHGGGVRGSHELASILITNLYALGFLEVYRRKADISLTILSDAIPVRFKLVYNNIILLIVMITLLILCYHTWDVFYNEIGRKTPGLRLPSTLYWVALAISTTLIVITILLDILTSLLSGTPAALAEEPEALHVET